MVRFLGFALLLVAVLGGVRSTASAGCVDITTLCETASTNCSVYTCVGLGKCICFKPPGASMCECKKV